jgi:hypothetical protein
MESIKQLKLVTGEEIIARIVEEDDHDVFLRNALTIQFRELDDGSRQYTFKLFMCYQDDPQRMIMTKMNSIIAVANPVEEMIRQYNQGCDNIFYGVDMEWDPAEEYDPYDAVMDKMSDSGTNNVLHFPSPPDKIH